MAGIDSIYAPTGLKTGGPCIFQGAVGPVEGSALVGLGMETLGGPQTLVKLSDAEDQTGFVGIHLPQQSFVLGTQDGEAVYPVTQGLVKALVRGGTGVNLTPVVTHTDGYLIAAIGAYSADTNVVGELRLPDGVTADSDGLWFVYLYGPHAAA